MSPIQPSIEDFAHIGAVQPKVGKILFVGHGRNYARSFINEGLRGGGLLHSSK